MITVKFCFILNIIRYYNKIVFDKKDCMNNKSQKIDSLANECDNKIIDIELIENMIMAIENENDSSKQSYESTRSSSLVMSNNDKLLLDRFNNKIS